MFTPELWFSTQQSLLADPRYVGVRANTPLHGIILYWQGSSTPSPTARAAINELESNGIQIENHIASASAAEVVAEKRRLINSSASGIAIYIAGTNRDDTRVDLTVATGSFAEAMRNGTDVLTELAPRVPVAISEGGQPVPAG